MLVATGPGRCSTCGVARGGLQHPIAAAGHRALVPARPLFAFLLELLTVLAKSLAAVMDASKTRTDRLVGAPRQILQS